MTIKEVEEKTGLTRSNVRFYEKEKLIQPNRDDRNGYRNYTERDVENIKKVAYLRTLGISLESIRLLINHEVELRFVIEKQSKILEEQIGDLEKAKQACQKMLASEQITYDELDIEVYESELMEYWEANQRVLKMDSVRFLYLWGGSLIWGMITAIGFLLALLAYPHLPMQIPIQWSEGEVSSEVGRIFIFAYPTACVIIRFLLRPFIWTWFKKNLICSDVVTDYVTNYLCFIALSVEIFTILFVNGVVNHVTVLLLIDTSVFFGILMKGWKRLRVRD